MKVSATEEHGLRCLMRLAVAWKTGDPVTIPEVARCEGMSPTYVAKLVAILRRADLVRSVRGVKGGVGLSRAPENMTLTEAMSALAGAPVRTGPCMGPESMPCERSGTCGLRNVWNRVANAVTTVLDGVTIADLVEGGRAGAVGGETRDGLTIPARWAVESRV